MIARLCVCAAFVLTLSSCDKDVPTSPTCDVAITIGAFSNGAPPTPGQGTPWTSFFAATVLPAQALVYIVDLNFSPSGCLTPWTAVSSDTSAVQVSPASGNGRGQVELFMPANTGAQRSTNVTIAGQTAVVTQSGR